MYTYACNTHAVRAKKAGRPPPPFAVRPALPYLGLHLLLKSLSTFPVLPPLLSFFVPLLRTLISEFDADSPSSDNLGDGHDAAWQAWQVLNHMDQRAPML